MRSQMFPLPMPSPDPTQFHPLDLEMQLDMEQEPPEQCANIQEECGEESTIEMCHVQLLFDGNNMGEQVLPGIALYNHL